MSKKKRPKSVPGVTVCQKTGCGSLYITDNVKGDYQEIFLELGKTGSCSAAFLQVIAVITSKGLRGILTIEDVIRVCKGTRCPSSTWTEGIQILSCFDAVAKVLEENAALRAKEEEAKKEEEEEEISKTMGTELAPDVITE